MIKLSLVSDNGPTDSQWREMAANPVKYRPLIAQLVGYFMMCGAGEEDRDVPAVGSLVKAAMPNFSDLTEDEAYFVHIGAMAVLVQYDAFETVSTLADCWFGDGAPE